MHKPLTTPGSTTKFVLAGISTLLVGYALAVVFGWPQAGTALVNGAAAHSDEHPAAHADASHATSSAHHDAEHAADHTATDHHAAANAPPPVYTVLPFVLLLGAIAVFPLIHSLEHWWESNLHRFYVAGGLGLVTLLYYTLLHQHPVDRHFLGHAVVEPALSGPNWAIAWTVIQNAIFNEFIPFITLLFSLYTICGGIRIEGDLKAHPITNAAFIAIGAVLANLIGTTGAAMLLIRPLLETNQERKHVTHTVVFFIFAVCNCGGCLTPLGDPPLFLGYLQGVDFTWTALALWKPWLFVNFMLVAVYWAWDYFYAYPRETKSDIARDERLVKNLRFTGLLNVAWLMGVVLAVGLLDPSKTVPGTDWHPWLFLREALMLGMVGLSLATGSELVRLRNTFNYAAIIEVAALFVGIFVCMQPALQILNVHGGSLGIDTPQEFFWATGFLSSVLDNAPTYLVFFQTAQTLDPAGQPLMAGVAHSLLVAISLGAVFMGAMTYIGNGPNFMVKAIAEKSGVAMPSFFGYVLYSVGVLLPLLGLTAWLFL